MYNVGDIDEFFWCVNFFIQMVLDDLEKFLKNFNAVGDILTNDIPLINKVFVLRLNMRVLLKKPLTS